MDVVNQNNLRQVCVLWDNPVQDGYGGFSYDEPIEIKCRWEDSNDVVRNSSGNEVVSKSSVQVDRDITEQAILFLGTLIETEGKQPKELKDAYIVITVQRTPNIKNTKTTIMARL